MKKMENIALRSLCKRVRLRWFRELALQKIVFFTPVGHGVFVLLRQPHLFAIILVAALTVGSVARYSWHTFSSVLDDVFLFKTGAGAA